MNLYVVDFEPTPQEMADVQAEIGAALQGLMPRPQGPKPLYVVAPDLVSAAAKVETEFPNRAVLALSAIRCEGVLLP